MRLLAILSMAGGLATYGLTATAQEVSPEIDTNGDGMYSLDELQTVHPDLDEQTFTDYDADGDGFLNPAEYQAGLDDAEINPPDEED